MLLSRPGDLKESKRQPLPMKTEVRKALSTSDICVPLVIRSPTAPSSGPAFSLALLLLPVQFQKRLSLPYNHSLPLTGKDIAVSSPSRHTRNLKMSRGLVGGTSLRTSFGVKASDVLRRVASAGVAALPSCTSTPSLYCPQQSFWPLCTLAATTGM